MTTRVWFENDAIQMDGVGVIPARGLYTVLEGDRVHIFTLAGDRTAQLLYGEYARKDGSGFASAVAAKAYLDGEFAKPIMVSVTWDTLPGKPTAFPPSAHTHPWTDLTGVPVTFPPSAHSHPISDVTGLQAALDGKQPAGSYLASSSFTWANLAGKPTTFAPSAHTHLWADITDRPTIPAATPLGTATPQALGTAAAGTSANASREDHVHPKPTGLLTQLGTATVGETLGLAVSLGVRRYTVTVTGAAVGDRLIVALTGVPSNGTIQDAYVSAANTVNVGLLVPALGIGAVVAVPLAIYKVS